MSRRGLCDVQRLIPSSCVFRTRRYAGLWHECVKASPGNCSFRAGGLALHYRQFAIGTCLIAQQAPVRGRLMQILACGTSGNHVCCDAPRRRRLKIWLCLMTTSPAAGLKRFRVRTGTTKPQQLSAPPVSRAGNWTRGARQTEAPQVALIAELSHRVHTER